MDNRKYIGMDVHQATISIAVLNSPGKLVIESVIGTNAVTIVQFVRGLRQDLHVIWEDAIRISSDRQYQLPLASLRWIGPPPAFNRAISVKTDQSH